MDVQVNFDALSTGHGDVMGVYKALTDTLDQLEKDLNPMVSTWSGGAREAYYQKKQQWDQAAAGLAQILNQIGSAVASSHDNYQAAEKHNTGLWA